MRKGLVLMGLALVVLATVLTLLVHGVNMPVLEPRGIVALKERNLMMLATLLGLIVVVPVLGLTFVIAWRYRAGNTKARYTPDWDGNRALELTWWGIPLAIIAVLAVITWQSSHDLDPYKPLASDQSPLTVQVVALDWKWLFIYPQQHIATVNYVQIPVGRPVNFEITADAPMNSFWIPQLGGQVYAMAGMSTQLHLMASEAGGYAGSSANISGRGFAGMRFVAQATAPADFNAWVAATQQGSTRLSGAEYTALARPSENQPAASYAAVEPQLYDRVIMSYMMPNVNVAATR